MPLAIRQSSSSSFDRLPIDTSAREVSAQEGQELANKLGCEFVEISARDGSNVELPFYGAVCAMRRS